MFLVLVFVVLCTFVLMGNQGIGGQVLVFFSLGVFPTELKKNWPLQQGFYLLLHLHCDVLLSFS